MSSLSDTTLRYYLKNKMFYTQLIYFIKFNIKEAWKEGSTVD